MDGDYPANISGSPPPEIRVTLKSWGRTTPKLLWRSSPVPAILPQACPRARLLPRESPKPVRILMRGSTVSSAYKSFSTVPLTCNQLHVAALPRFNSLTMVWEIPSLAWQSVSQCRRERISQPGLAGRRYAMKRAPAWVGCLSVCVLYSLTAQRHATLTAGARFTFSYFMFVM